MDMDGITLGEILISSLLDVTGLGAAQLALEVYTHTTVSLLLSVEEVKELLLEPVLFPLTCH